MVLLVAALCIAAPGVAVTPQISAEGKHTLALQSDGRLWAWGENSNGQLGDGTTTRRTSPVLIGSGFVAVAAGFTHSLAIKEDGTLWAWGNNTNGQVGIEDVTLQLSPVQIGAGFSALSAGYFHSVALKPDGSVWTWGANAQGQLGNGDISRADQSSPAQIGTGYSAIAAGAYHTVGIKSADNTLWAWGQNLYRQIGMADLCVNDSCLTPIAIGSGYSVVAAGYKHTLAIKPDKSLWTWGANGWGQLGDGTTDLRSAPVLIGTGFVAVAGGTYHSVALKDDGSLWAWGNNQYGQVGNDSTTNQLSPVQVGDSFSAVSAGEDHTLAIQSDGNLRAWGRNASGQLGIGNNSNCTTPVQVGNATSGFFNVNAGIAPANVAGSAGFGPGRVLLQWTPIYGATSYKVYLATQPGVTKANYASLAGGQVVSGPTTPHTLAGLAPGTAYYMVLTAVSAAGEGTESAEVSATPVQASLKAIGTGWYHTLALQDDASLWAWGFNGDGALGDGTTQDRLSGIRIGTDYGAIAAGGFHSVALKRDGSLWAWGMNGYGQLGDGTTTGRSSPVLIGTGYSAIAAGTVHTAALKADGSLWAWGSNESGQLGDGTTADRSTPVPVGTGYLAVAAGERHTVALKTDGSLWAWGNNNWGQLGDGTKTERWSPVPIGTGYVAVAAGPRHTVALKQDGTIWAWGSNGDAQIGDGTNVDRPSPVQVGSGFVAVKTSSDHTLALKSDGSLWAWGYNYQGQVGDGTTTTRSSPVQVGTGFNALAAGGYTSFGLKTDGTLWAWGWNAYGQLGDGTTTDRLVPTQICAFCAPLPQGSIARWRAEGNTYDGAGTSNGTLQNGAGFAAGKAGQAFSFDGVDDYVDAGTDPAFNFFNGSGDFTIEVWIRPSAMPAYGSGIVTKGGGAPYTGWSFYFYGDGRLGFGGLGAWEFTSTTGTIVANQWAHVAMTREGNTYRLFKDGIEVSAVTHGNLETSTAPLKIGRVFQQASEDPGACGTSLCSFNGLIDEVGIYGRALSAVEIASQFSRVNPDGSFMCFPPDSTPDALSFTEQTGTPIGVGAVSAPITVSGINQPSPISIAGGEYSVNGAGFTASTGTVVNGDSVAVRLPASFGWSATRSATLTIGGVSGAFSATTRALATGAAMCVAPPSSLVSAWRGEDDALDLTGRNPGAMVNGASFANGLVGRAFDFHGGSDYVVAPDSASLDVTTQFTLSAWVYPRSFAGSDNAVISKVGGPGGNFGYQMGLGRTDGTGPTTLFCLFNAQSESWPANALAVGSVETNAWTHLACTYDGDSLKAYVNGALAGSLVVGAKTVANSSSSLRISGDDNNHFYFDGLVDEPQVYGRALTAGEIGAVADAGGAGLCHDTAPASFAFGEQIDALPATVTESNAVTLAGLGQPTPVSVAGGEYSVNGGAFTAAPGTVVNGDAIRVRAASPAAPGATASATLTIGSTATTFNVTTAGPCVAPPSGLLAWWKSEDGTGDSAGPSHGVMQNGAGFTDGRVGRAFSFDGVDGVVRIPSAGLFKGRSEATIAAWVRPQGAHSDDEGFGGQVYAENTSAADWTRFGIYVLNDGRVLGFGRSGESGASSSATTTATVPFGQWSHVAATWNATEGIRVYIDGVLQASLVASVGSFTGTETSFMSIGAGGFNAGSLKYLFNGVIDELQLFGRSLSAQEVLAIFRSGGAGLCASCAAPPAGLVGYWSGNGNANDLAGTLNGTLLNGAGFAPGMNGQAFSFDGVASRVLIGDPVPAALQIQNEITLEAWIYATAYPTVLDAFGNKLGLIVGSQYDTGNAGVSMFLDGRVSPDGQPSPAGHIHFQIGGDGWHATNSNSQVPLNQWVHIVATRKANEAGNIYYNGVLQPSTSAPWSGPIDYSGAWFAIGQQKDLNRPFNGLIDEVKIYNRALSAAEVVANYTAAGGAGMCVADTTPDTFTIPARSGAALGAPVESDPITVSGVNTATATSVSGGEYSVNGGAYTAAAGTVANGDTVRVRVAGPAGYAGSTSATLTIGGVSASFDVTTPAFPAASIPQAGLRLWLKADKGVVAGAADAVSRWYDQSGNGFDVGQDAVAKRPTLLPGVVGGKSALHFDGADDYLQTPAPIGLLDTGAISVFVVLNPGSTQRTYADVLDYTHATNVNYVMQQYVDETNNYYGGGGAQQLTAGRFQVFSNVLQNGGVGTTYVNGGRPSDSGPFNLSFAEPNYFTVGSKSLEVVPRQWNGDIAEVLIYNRALSPSERATVEAYLFDKYALDVSPAPLSFGGEAAAVPGGTVMSGMVDIAGINAEAPVSITGGEYSLDGGSTFTSANALVAGGTVRVRVTAPPTPGDTAVATLSIGGTTGTFSVTASSAACLAPVASGLVSLWRGNGNAGDSTGLSHGTQVNSVGFVPGVSGQAFSFDGNVSYVEAPDRLALRIGGTVSASFWAKRQRLGIDIVMEKGGDWNVGETNYGAGLHQINNNMFYFYARGGWWGVDGVSDMDWHHYAFVATHGQAEPTLYVDGVARPVLHHAGGPSIDLYPSTRALHIGAQVDPGASYIGQNILDEVQVFNRALTAQEVAAMHAAGAACLRPPAVTVNVVPGFNLAGNGVEAVLDVQASFGSADQPVEGVSGQVEAIWAWNASTRKWRFHTPQFTRSQSAAYAAANGYESLTQVAPGEGFWVNAYQPIGFAVPGSSPAHYNRSRFNALPGGFNLLATGASMAPGQFNVNLSETPPSPGTVPENFNALWAWDAMRGKWYFYSPSLEQPNAPFTNQQYAATSGYLDFGGGTPPAPALSLAPGMGFWVEKFGGE